jgi:hypothetical protein
MPSTPKHRARAVEAMARHRCETDKTDGFCCPRDGKCQRNLDGKRDHLDCMRSAENLMRTLEGRGMSVVWDHDPANHPDPMVNAAELAAIRGL